MIFWLLSCTSPNTETVSSSKFLTLLRGDSDDIMETVLSALQFHNMRPDTVLYHPRHNDLIDDLQSYIQNCTTISTNKPTIASIPKEAQSVIVLTDTQENIHFQNTVLQKNSYISWSSSKDWDHFFDDATEKIIPLTPKKTIPLKNVPEPSGLAIHPKTRNLWTVSDETGMIIDLGIDAQNPDTPHVHNAFQITEYDENDLEGIAFINDKTCVVVESQRKLLCYDDSFKKISDQKIEGPYSPEKDNKGPEGISEDGLIINEGFPTAISNTGRILFIGTDISGIAKDGEQYWILSQTDGTITLVNSKFQTEKIYNFPDYGLEGIAVYGSSLFVISDPNETLYEIQKPRYKSPPKIEK